MKPNFFRHPVNFLNHLSSVLLSKDGFFFFQKGHHGLVGIEEFSYSSECMDAIKCLRVCLHETRRVSEREREI